MKRIVRLCVFLMALFFAGSFVTAACAAGSVTYAGRAKSFIFAPGTKDSPVSLFENFQDVMPGDTLTEQILIKNDTSHRVKIRVYMRSLGAQGDTGDFLSQMNLTVEQEDDSILFAAPADETAQLTNWVYLGTVYSGGEIPLKVTLDVPITMGNDYQNEIGYIDWEFRVDELPIDPSDPKPPQTADTSNIVLYSGLMVFSLAALIILLVGKRKK
ncbi:MAG: hypothetical protein IKU68_04400 [Oscillospiraceae bacterium]|nr:hypothetical protein [Oscillospiraceae bacterium]